MTLNIKHCNYNEDTNDNEDDNDSEIIKILKTMNETDNINNYTENKSDKLKTKR